MSVQAIYEYITQGQANQNVILYRALHFDRTNAFLTKNMRTANEKLTAVGM
jgi:hypothetical protein